MSQSWMIASGKGGVGKSMVAAALGVALAKRQLQCCCVDADIGLRNLDMLLGMQNKVVYDVLDVARRDCKLKYALIRHTLYESLSLLPAAQLGSVCELRPDEVERIVRKLKKRVAYVPVSYTHLDVYKRQDDRQRAGHSRAAGQGADGLRGAGSGQYH